MEEIFPRISVTNDRRNAASTFLLSMVHTVKHGNETIRYRGQRIWQSLPQEIKNSVSFHHFKKPVRSRNGNIADFASDILFKLAFYDSALASISIHNFVLFLLSILCIVACLYLFYSCTIVLA